MRILFVDDVEPIRELAGLILTKAGHSVEFAGDGDQALRVYFERGPFDLLITDYCHEGPDGIELVHRIHAVNPTQAVLLSTTFLQEEVWDGRLRLPLLLKPYDPNDLLDAVNAAATPRRVAIE